MSSGSRGPPAGRHGGDSDYKHRKSFYASSTRRDFKSSAAQSSAGPGLSLLTRSSLPVRQDKPSPGEYTSRPRFRDSVSAGAAASGGRSASFSKDSRYGNSKQYPLYLAGYYHGERGNERNDRGADRSERHERSGERNDRGADRNDRYSERNNLERSDRNDRSTGAYGTFNAAKRDDGTYTSRDMVNGGARSDGWRSTKPGSNGSTKSFSSSRFNPNNIRVHVQGGVVALEHKKDSYSPYSDEYNNRWKNRSEKPRRSRPSGRPSKERIRSSGLTNSVGTPKRESYYPKTGQGRYTDRYSGRDHEERGKLRGNRSMSPDDRNDSADVSAEYDGSVSSRFSHDDTHGTDDQVDDENDNEIDDENEIRNEDDDDDHDDEDRDEDEEEEDEEDEDDEGDDKDDTNDVDDVMAESNEANGDFEATSDDHKETKEENPDMMDVDTPSRHVSTLSASADRSEEADTLADSTKSYSSSVQVNLDGPDDYPEGCNHPLTKLESQLVDITAEFESLGKKSAMSNSLLTKVSDITLYPFYISNLRQFSRNYEPMVEAFKTKKESLHRKKLSLWVEYDYLRRQNNERKTFLQEQLKVLHPPDDELRRELEAIDIRVKTAEPVNDSQFVSNDVPVQSGRRGRRHGDLVTTEAEFQEILKSLENEQDEDPLRRAERVAAKIPDFIIDPIERNNLMFMDSNNIVHDKEAWSARIKTDFMDTFTEHEHEQFCEGFCRSPKRFGQISRFMGGMRTAEECVIHYYMTKKAVNYKFLVSQFKKKSSKKSSRRKSKAKQTVQTVQTNLTSDTSPLSAVDITESSGQKSDDVAKSDDLDSERKRKHDKLETDEQDADNQDETPSRKRSKTEKDETPSVSPQVPQLSVLETPLNGATSNEQVLKAEPKAESVGLDATEMHPGDENGHGNDEKKKHISSYWSITEVNEFPILLKEFGSRWSSIAEKLTTKTATMVRNYYQRNANKNGWEDVVQSADVRRAHDSNPEEMSLTNVDTTIVVKPQKTSHIDVATTEIHVYDAIDDSGKSQDVSLQSFGGQDGPQKSAIPVGTFQHLKTYHPPRIVGDSSDQQDTPARPQNVTKFLSNPAPQEQNKAPPSLVNIAPAPVVSAVAQSTKMESQKSSIMNLLNSESGLVKMEPTIPLAPSKPSNLAALLNAPSSPRPLPEPKAQERTSNIKSLLAE